MPQPTDLAGYAVYAELHRGQATVQVLITPEGLTETFQHVNALMYRRAIHVTSPRSTWKVSPINKVATFDPMTGSLIPFGTMPAVSEPDLAAQVGVPALGELRIFQQLATQEYKLHKQTIVVEVSTADMTDLRLARTPYKVLNRITKSRKALGFNDSLFAEAAK